MKPLRMRHAKILALLCGIVVVAASSWFTSSPTVSASTGANLPVNLNSVTPFICLYTPTFTSGTSQQQKSGYQVVLAAQYGGQQYGVYIMGNSLVSGSGTYPVVNLDNYHSSQPLNGSGNMDSTLFGGVPNNGIGFTMIPFSSVGNPNPYGDQSKFMVSSLSGNISVQQNSGMIKTTFNATAHIRHALPGINVKVGSTVPITGSWNCPISSTGGGIAAYQDTADIVSGGARFPSHSPTQNHLTIGPPSKITGLSLNQTPKTPLWTLDLLASVDTSQVHCPATVTVASDGINSKAVDVCSDLTPNNTVHVQLPVFANNKELSPNHSASFTVTINDKQGKTTYTSSIQVPPSPVWIGIGDSYSSGHNQTNNACVKTPNRGVDGCTITWNDPHFSWVTRAVDDLNDHYFVPNDWIMKPNLLALSGATSNEMVGGSPLVPDFSDGSFPASVFESPRNENQSSCDLDLAKNVPSLTCDRQNQVLQMQTALKQQGDSQDSWDIVSLTGGANDAPWVNMLLEFYFKEWGHGHKDITPWDGTNVNDCPNNNFIMDYQNQLHTYKDMPGAQISGNKNAQQNLLAILEAAHKADSNVRLVNLLYSYGDDASSECFLPKSKTSILYGNKVVTDTWDNNESIAVNTYEKETKGTVIQVDGRQLFGTNPLHGKAYYNIDTSPVCTPSFTKEGYVQQTRAGYPHPDCIGQQLIANCVAERIEFSNQKCTQMVGDESVQAALTAYVAVIATVVAGGGIAFVVGKRLTKRRV